MSCKRSIKANHHLEEEQAKGLLKNFQRAKIRSIVRTDGLSWFILLQRTWSICLREFRIRIKRDLMTNYKQKMQKYVTIICASLEVRICNVRIFDRHDYASFPAYIVVENNGIGYLINVANPFRFKSDETKQEKIYLHQIVRENEIVLYGFSDFNEKQLF